MQELVDEWQKSIRALAIECSILSLLRERGMSDDELKYEFKDRTKGVEMLFGVDPCRSLPSMESRGLISVYGVGKCHRITGKGAAWLAKIVSCYNTHISRS